MLQLDSADAEMLSGARGEGAQLAMQMIVHVGELCGAERLTDVTWAHVTSAYYQGRANLDFARRLAAAHTRVAIPTTLTACSIDLRAPDTLVESDNPALELIGLYKAMGCDPVMTCAPYHARDEPRFGEHLAWCESSAVVYANSILGARSNRYVEFVDMCAAVTGRVPLCGLHRGEERRATMLFQVTDVPDKWLQQDWFFHALGFLLGRETGGELPAISGLPAGTTVEHLRALGSAAASSGSLSMFHAIGITPEAASVEDAFQGCVPADHRAITADDIMSAARILNTGGNEPLSAICVGAPHFSVREFEDLEILLSDRSISGKVKFYASTSASVVARLDATDLLDRLVNAGVQFVVGRCTYYRPAMPGTEGRVMTNSAKWAYYAPSGLGATVTFASLADCVESAVAGRIVIDRGR
ncbi:MAG: aconitase X [Woeseiaceae bacterium]